MLYFSKNVIRIRPDYGNDSIGTVHLKTDTAKKHWSSYPDLYSPLTVKHIPRIISISIYTPPIPY